MDFEEFRKMVISEVQKELGNIVTVTAKDVTKNNGIVYRGLEIAKKGSNIAPCIYLNRFSEYDDMKENLSQIVEKIIAEYENSKDSVKFDASNLADYEKIRASIRGRLVNTEKNKERLNEMPHRELLDLSFSYVVEIPMAEGSGSIQITNEHLKVWNVNEEILFRQAISNMDAAGDSALLTLSDMLKEMTECDLPPEPDAMPMYVLTNQSKQFGASQMMRTDALKDAADKIGNDYFVIPSSVHEVLLVSDNGQPDMAESIAEMVDSVNRTQVADEEILSFHVYRYDKDREQVSIAA